MTKLVKTKEGVLIEISGDDDSLQHISSNSVTQVDASLDQVKTLLKKTVEPITSVWDELNKDLSIEQVDVTLSLGFEAEGNVFIAKGKASTSVDIKLTLKPK